MGSVSQVKDLDFLMDCVTDSDRQFRLALPESVVIQDSAHRHYGRLVIRHLDTN